VTALHRYFREFVRLLAAPDQYRNEKLELSAADRRAIPHICFFGLRLDDRSYLFGRRKCSADISVFRIDIERNEAIAVLAIQLEIGADPLRPRSENLRAFSAFDLHFIIDH
jgi:hypothetical protein